MLVPNGPPWLVPLLKEEWDAIARAVGPTLLPMLHGRPGFQPIEFGTGHYGTVMPTERPEVVVKVTIDMAEAAFVVAALAIGEFPPGIVRYQHVFHLGDVKHKDIADPEPVWILWRQEARNIGILGAWEKDPESPQQLAAAQLVVTMLFAGRRIHDADGAQFATAPMWVAENEQVMAWAKRTAQVRRLRNSENVAAHIDKYEDARATALALTYFRAAAAALAKSPVASALGTAFGFYYDHGIVLADVHLGNIGKVGKDLVITDPGHAVFLTRKWDSAQIPDLQREP